MTHLFAEVFLGLAVAALTAVSYAQFSNPAADVPAYHPSAPLHHRCPAAHSGWIEAYGTNFRYPWQTQCLSAGCQGRKRRLPASLQLPLRPCLGPHQLRSCFEGLHGTECSTCAKEGFYAYQQTKLGKTPAQIRAGIARHDYESIDLDKQ